MPRAKVLVADDSATVRTQVRRMLCEKGFEVWEASDGSAAVELVRSYPPDLAILDIEMPKLDGYGVCQHLKEKGPPWDEVPVIFLTSRSSHALELLGQQLGAYVRKSTNLEQLPDVVSEVMARQANQLRNGSHTAAPAAQPAV